MLITLQGSRRQSSYIGGILLHLLVMMYQLKKKLPAWRMFASNPTVYNEEAGEQGFGILARCVLGDSQRGKFTHLNEMYTMIHMYMSVDRDIASDAPGFAPSNWRKTYDMDSPEVVGTVSWLKLLFRRMRHNTCTVYDGTKSGFKNAATAGLHQEPRTATTSIFDVDRVPDMLTPLLARLQEKIRSLTWAARMTDVWPEFEHLPEPGEGRPVLAEMVPMEGNDDADEYVAQEIGNAQMESDADEEEQDGQYASTDSDSDAERPYAEVVREDVGAKRKARDSRGAFDVNERGEPVPWGGMSRVDAGNIMQSRRSERQKKAQADNSRYGMVSSF